MKINFRSSRFCFSSQLKAAYSHLDDFCKLPESTKELYLRDSETGNHGYVKPGQERFDGKTKDIRHAYNICTLNLKLPEEVSTTGDSLHSFKSFPPFAAIAWIPRAHRRGR